MAEFWWGPSPASEIRHHGEFYPACRGKCKPVLTWMLQGLDVDPDPEQSGFLHQGIEIIYEDDAIAHAAYGLCRHHTDGGGDEEDYREESFHILFCLRG
jgi:hypothetical protein